MYVCFKMEEVSSELQGGITVELNTHEPYEVSLYTPYTWGIA